MARTTRKAEKRASVADRGRPRARKSSAPKASKSASHNPKPAKSAARKQKPSPASETPSLKRQLQTARRQQQASAEILRAVANTAGDIGRPLQFIAETTARLFGAQSVSIQLAEGSEFTQEYRVGAIAKRVGSAYPRSNIKVGGRNLPGTVVAESRQIHIPDLDQLDPSMSDFPGLPHARAGGARTVCGTPLRREGNAIGALIIFRDKLLPFTYDELALLQSFADQAVIAIENARLFNEVEARTHDVSEALAHQTASAEVLQVIGRSMADAQPVFERIVDSIEKLLPHKQIAIFVTSDNGLLHVGALRGARMDLVHALYPLPVAQTAAAAALEARQQVYFPDLLHGADAPPSLRHVAEVAGNFSDVLTPLLWQERGVGVIAVTREPNVPFSERELSLLRSFADQAVIAIENARLFNEVQARTRNLQESLHQQTATAEVLKVINRSAFDLQPVLNTLARTAAQICDAEMAFIYRRDGEVYRTAAAVGMTAEYEQHMKTQRLVPGRGTLTGRAALERRVIHIEDLAADPNYQLKETITLGKVRTALGVPLLREGKPIGVFTLARSNVRPFTEKQIELVTTFADQAVIAIENTRLLTEQREALEQQTATAEVLGVINSSPGNLAPVFDAMLEKAIRLCDAVSGHFRAYDGNCFPLVAVRGEPANVDAMRLSGPLVPGPHHPVSGFLRGDSLIHLPNAKDSEGYRADARFRSLIDRGVLSLLAIALRKDARLLGYINVYRHVAEPFTDRQIALLQNFAEQAVIAMENARLLTEQREALEQQTATADVLKVISRSVFDLQIVLDTLVDSAYRLCGANLGLLYLKGDEAFECKAIAGVGVEEASRYFKGRPIRAGRATSAERVIMTGDVQSVDDFFADPDFDPGAKEVIRNAGSSGLGVLRSTLAVPMTRDNSVVGVLVIASTHTGPFPQRQIDVLQTFADQAVIAIENVRLFDEVQAKTRDLEEALTYQTGSANILRVIASSPTDVAPVLQAIVESACELCEAYDAVVMLKEGEELCLGAHHGPIPMSRQRWSNDRASVSGRAMADCLPVHVHDMLSDEGAEFVIGREMSRVDGCHTILGAPLLREGEAIGAILLRRAEVHPFSDKQIALLQTFADQAVIALGNVRLFDEVQARTRDLAKSLDELRTAQDRLVQTEKLASLGQLTAGIAHEIKNPLNFVNNFSSLSAELIDELDDALAPAPLDQNKREELSEITATLKSNLEKVVQHGKRADSIVKNMLLHSREGSGERRSADINALVTESLNLAYHGARAENGDFSIALRHDLDPDAGEIELHPQEMTRALLNLFSNGFYAATKRKLEASNDTFEPSISAITRRAGKSVEIRIRDNGTGIPPEVKEKIFNPFFTTKPTGEGTGLGLSMAHDIVVKQHGGRIDVTTEPGAFTEFIITLPRGNATADRSKPE